MSRTLSALATASQNAQQTEEVWLLLLRIWHANITPNGVLRFVNNNVDIHRPSTTMVQLLAATAFSGWTASNSTVSPDGAYSLISDASAVAKGNVSSNKTGLTSGTTYSGACRVEKDATGKATRYVAFTMTGGGGGLTTLYLDTSTGELVTATGGASGTAVASGVIDDGTAWLLYISRSGETSYTLTLSPAIGAGSTMSVGNENVATQGSISANQPWLWAGLIANFDTYIAYPFQLDLPGEDLEQPSVAKLRIDNVDLQIVQAIRGLPSAPTCDFEVILASQPTVTEIVQNGLTLRAADYDALVVEGTITFEEIFTEPVSLDMTPARFPGMF